MIRKAGVFCGEWLQPRSEVISFARDSLRSADELINIQTILLALDEMRSPADEMEAVGQGLKNLSADQGDRLGVRINRLAKAL